MRLNKICILIFTCCYNDHLYLDNTIIMCINLNSNKAPHAVVNFFFFFFLATISCSGSQYFGQLVRLICCS